MYIFLCCATCIYEGATCISDGVENLCETLDSASNLRLALGIMYYMVIHDSKRSAQV